MNNTTWISVRQIGQLSVVKLAGSDGERGAQHGAMLRDRIHAGPLTFFQRYLPGLLGGVPGCGNLTARAAMAKLISALLTAPALRRLPAWFNDGFYGLAEGADIAPRQLLQLVLAPDLMQILAGWMYWRRKIPPTAVPGCTAVLASAPATRDSHVIHARNLDYDGMGFWDANPAVFFVRPDVGIPHVMIGAAGLHSGGITGINAEGLTWNVHSAFTRVVDPAGAPVAFIGDTVLRNAATTSQALGIVRQHRPAAGWIFAVSDRRGDIAAIEADARHIEVIRGANGVLAISNSYRSPSLRRGEEWFSQMLTTNSLCRLSRAGQLAQRLSGQLDPAGALSVLRDRMDPLEGRQTVLGCAVAQKITLQTVVADNSAGQFWVSDGLAPACLGRLVGFDLAAEMTTADPPRPADLPAAHGVPQHQREALEHYYRAHRQWAWDANPAAALAELRQASAAAPDEPAILLMLAAAALANGEAIEAIAAADSVLFRAKYRATRDLAQLLRAYALDAAGNRPAARSEYAVILSRGGVFPPLRQAARRGYNRPVSRKRLRHIHPSLLVPDLFDYL